MEHTPAPWNYSNLAPSEMSFIIEDEHETKVIATIHGSNEANAKLIAAAPELLNALADLIFSLPPDYTNESFYVSEALKVISKAKGLQK